MINFITKLSLKEIVKSSGINQKALAKQLKMSEQWLSTILNKDIKELTIKQIEHICNSIGYKIDINITRE